MFHVRTVWCHEPLLELGLVLCQRSEFGLVALFGLRQGFLELFDLGLCLVSGIEEKVGDPQEYEIMRRRLDRQLTLSSSTSLFSTFFTPATELPRTLLRAAAVRGAADPATLLLSAEAPVPAPGRAAAEAGTEGLGLVVVAEADPLLVGLVTPAPAVEALAVLPRTELVRGGGRAVVVVLRRGADTPVPVPVAPRAAREDEAVERVRVDTRGFTADVEEAEVEVAGVVEGLVRVDGFVVGFASGLRAAEAAVLVAGTVLLAARREAVLAVSLEAAAVGAAPVDEVGGFSFETVVCGRRKAGSEGFKLGFLVVVAVTSVVGGLEPVGFGEVAEVPTSAMRLPCDSEIMVGPARIRPNSPPNTPLLSTFLTPPATLFTPLFCPATGVFSGLLGFSTFSHSAPSPSSLGAGPALAAACSPVASPASPASSFPVASVGAVSSCAAVATSSCAWFEAVFAFGSCSSVSPATPSLRGELSTAVDSPEAIVSALPS